MTLVFEKASPVRRRMVVSASTITPLTAPTMTNMPQYARLSSDDAHQMMIDREVNVIDIRDEESFKLSHITDCTHMDNSGIPAFIDQSDLDVPLIVCCYHGNMSQSAGAYLAEKGFETVFSLDGGFAEWQAKFPDDCEPD